ncbi:MULTISPECIES: aminotransferase class I/II-fold pyridoxal phosphate-dependent enzyme [unclassified Corynebacterium]|uniref:aminotransferase class I/II-fold pyridoxal phosphate-dependent enzyme n=1 Tax=unclassified Corynebacterium TaxID=2624378 RepID=UPI0029CA5D93|nr:MULTISPECIES: aminotransferase class I/II-fold pyridoxal phosphate-dependent enzyme [unclassified Corynebacterium]WPF66727.1 aminotransferase class I/II-fold pyridoxal phosphate-dependent enzyme [Corynebacterium sp. 22KM0430]WPF69215.1 aminotransferase class I/II-fold pyridoxal phosphate-dependent enzyme [Corynebacterium sp. 21KM1197]
MNISQRVSVIEQTVFAELSAKAERTKAVNLAQGFPDEDGPARMLEIARGQIATGHNQYAPLIGTPELRQAIVKDRRKRLGQNWAPDSEVCVTSGATEGIMAAVLATVNPGDEVIVIDPFYDSYGAAISFAGGIRRSVPLNMTQEGTWALDFPAIRKALSPNTTAIIVNNPHNPTGAIFSEEQLSTLAELVKEHSLTVISDEVYERLLLPGEEFIPTASVAGLREQTITVSSASKSFNVTGWKTGWVLGPEPLVAAVTKAKQFLTFVSATPFQAAVAHALREEETWVTQWQEKITRRRALLADALESSGWRVHPTRGSYFLVAREPHEGALPEGVVALPVAALSDFPERWEGYYRFAFCKSEEATAEAARRIKQGG